MLQAAIFDMDGTMVDTEHIQSQAFESILREYDVEPQYTKHGTIHTPGATSQEIWDALKEAHGITADTEELIARKRQAVIEVLSKGIEAMPGVADMIMELKAYNIPLAIATAARRNRTELIIEKIGMTKHFSVFITGDDVVQTKPNPASYIAAAKALGVAPENCVAFEDTDVGVQAAKAANMKVVAVPNQYTYKMDFSQADIVKPSLTNVSFEEIVGLF